MVHSSPLWLPLVLTSVLRAEAGMPATCLVEKQEHTIDGFPSHGIALHLIIHSALRCLRGTYLPAGRSLLFGLGLTRQVFRMFRRRFAMPNVQARIPSRPHRDSNSLFQTARPALEALEGRCFRR
jgi:hypothetical protein